MPQCLLLMLPTHDGPAAPLQVRETGSQQSPIIEDLRKAQDAAQQAGVGLWTKVSGATPTGVECVCLIIRVNASILAHTIGLASLL